MSRIRTVFFGTPEFAKYCLEGLIRDDHFEIVGVVTQPDRPAGRKLQLQPSPVKALVEPLGIPLIAAEQASHSDVVAEIASWRGEAAVVVAFGQILRQGILDLFPRKIVNVHASLLPRWRGAAPIQRALMAGDRETGVCLQVLVPKLDAGDVLGSRRIEITDAMDAKSLHDALMPLALELLRVDLMDYLRGNLTAKPQDESRVTYAHKIDKKEASIDWTKPALAVFNHIRGLALGPGAVCRRGSASLKVHRTKVDPHGKGSPGKVVRVDADCFTVACGEQALQVWEVQPESRARMSAQEYLKGYPVALGDQFE